MTLKKGFGKCSFFVSSANGFTDQNMTSSFSRQRNPNMEKALFDWPIVLQYDVKAISRKFFGHEVCLPERSLSQPKARCVCIRFIHQSNRSISVRLLFLFCSRVFMSRSYENRSITWCAGFNPQTKFVQSRQLKKIYFGHSSKKDNYPGPLSFHSKAFVLLSKFETSWALIGRLSRGLRGL